MIVKFFRGGIPLYFFQMAKDSEGDHIGKNYNKWTK